MNKKELLKIFGKNVKIERIKKDLTQEQLAEKFNVSNRTVSRWETGSNMPDLSVLVELADFYRVDIKEIIDGERKSEIMNEETRETLLKVAEYTTEDKKKSILWNEKNYRLHSYGIWNIFSDFSTGNFSS